MAILVLATVLAISAGRLDFHTAIAWARMFALLLVFYAVVRLFPDRASLRQLMKVAVAAASISGFVALVIAFGADLSSVLGQATTYYVNTDLGLEASAHPPAGHRPRLPAVLVRGIADPAHPRHRPARLDPGRPGHDRQPGAEPQPQHVGGPAPGAGSAHVHRRRARPPAGRGRRPRARRRRRPHRHRRDPGGPRPARRVRRARPDALLAREDHAGELAAGPRQGDRAGLADDQGAPGDRHRPGAEFGVYFDELQPGGRTYKREHQLFLHNQYLYLLLICGIPGLLAFLGFLTAAVGRARWHLSDTDIATWAVGVAMIAVSAFVMISFADASSALAIGLLCGAIVAATSRTYADS